VGKPQFRYGRVVVLAVALAAVGLSGCGRTDPKAPPPGTAPNGQFLLGQQAPPPAPPPAPPKRFLFDFMLN
jgi:hypothetical protein